MLIQNGQLQFAVRRKVLIRIGKALISDFEKVIRKSVRPELYPVSLFGTKDLIIPAALTDDPETVPSETEPPAPQRIYQDGTFTASAYGYDGNITVHVTILNDTITDITAETEESDDSYFFDAKSAVIPAIILSQAADVDACSGATYSSNGIMEAVRTALEQAKV